MLLQDWSDYTRTDDYQAQRQRAQIDAIKDSDTKLKLYLLRRRRREAKAGRASDQWTQYFQSGNLDKELTRLTQEHGYGRIYDETGSFEDIRPATFGRYLTERKEPR